MLGDLGFIGSDVTLTGIKRKPKQPLQDHERGFNDAIGHVRSLVEHQFTRFKKFKCLSTPWRHGMLQHHRAFHVIAQLVQLDLLLEADFTPHPAVVLTEIAEQADDGIQLDEEHGENEDDDDAAAAAAAAAGLDYQ